MGEAKRRRDAGQRVPLWTPAISAQDAYAQLIEDSRIGSLQRIDTRHRDTYIPFKTDVDLEHLPVFYLGEVDDRLASYANNVPEHDVFRLPYPRCGFLYRMGSATPNVATQFSLLVADEIDDDILVHAYFRYDDHTHWTRHDWQGIVTPSTGEIEMNFDPQALSPTISAKLLELKDYMNRSRMTLMLLDAHRIVTCPTGRATAGDRGVATMKIDERRQMIDLPPVPRIRILDFGLYPDPVTASQVRSAGGARAPHYRRGTWRQLPTGRKVWVRSAAIHGGTPDRPPWYEVR